MKSSLLITWIPYVRSAFDFIIIYGNLMAFHASHFSMLMCFPRKKVYFQLLVKNNDSNFATFQIFLSSIEALQKPVQS